MSYTFRFFNKLKRPVNKKNSSRPYKQIKNELTRQDFPPVAENMSIYNYKTVIKLVIFYRRPETEYQDNAKQPDNDENFIQCLRVLILKLLIVFWLDTNRWYIPYIKSGHPFSDNYIYPSGN
jgi:hypothetical protein